MKVNTNITSLKTQNYLRKSQAGLEQTMERLSSGKRINNAGDDAAGLSISARMDSKIRGMEVGVRNSNDGISMVQTAESGLGSIGNILQRMRELTVQSANGTNTASDRTSLDNEFTQLKAEIDHIADKTTFNGLNLLSSAGTVKNQLSDLAGDTMDVKTLDVTSATLALTTDITTAANATTALGELDAAINTIANGRAEYGANLNRLNFNIDNITSMSTNLSNAKSRIEDADMAKEVSEMTKFKILTQTGMSMLTQANQNPQQITQLLQG